MLRFDVSQLLVSLVSVSSRVQDLIFSVGKPPLVAVDGKIKAARLEGLEHLTPFHTEMIIVHLLRNAPGRAPALAERGAVSFTFSIPGKPRFRASVFQQRNSYAAVIRAIPEGMPRLDKLELAEDLGWIVDELRSGIVLINGPSGSGRSTTIAALLEEINHRRACHIVTVEEQIEFMHRHAEAVVHQREVGTDTPSLREGLEDSLRQGADVIMLSGVPDRESASLMIEAADTGHLVITSVRGLDTGSALRRLVSLFDSEEHGSVCRQLARTLKVSFTQRLLPSKEGGRALATEVWRNLPTTREQLFKGEISSQAIGDVLRDAAAFGARPFDMSLEVLVRANKVNRDLAIGEAVVPKQLELRLLDITKGAS
jgi:twitching motility protein PilT